MAEEDFEHALRANLDSGARPSFTEVDARTIVPLEDFSAAARCQPSLSQLPDYISAGVQDCLKEANKSVKFVRNSGDFLTDRLKHATRSAGRGGIHSLDAHSPWQRPQTKNVKPPSWNTLQALDCQIKLKCNCSIDRIIMSHWGKKPISKVFPSLITVSAIFAPRKVQNEVLRTYEKEKAYLRG